MSDHEKFADDLPLLVLGALDGPAREAVEAHARSCDECSRELQRLNADLAMLALTTPLEQPPARAKTRLMTTITKEPKTRAMRSTPQRGRWWMLIPSAVSLGLLVLVAALWNANHSMQRDLEAMRHDAMQARADTQRAADMIKMLAGRDPNTIRVTLVAMNAKPQPTGRAVYSPKTGHLVLFASNFASVPQDKAYELWIIPQQGAPIPAGVFKPDAEGTVTMMLPTMPKDVQTKAFAITIEPAGGSATPTMPIMMMGQSA